MAFPFSFFYLCLKDAKEVKGKLFIEYAFCLPYAGDQGVMTGEGWGQRAFRGHAVQEAECMIHMI